MTRAILPTWVKQFGLVRGLLVRADNIAKDPENASVRDCVILFAAIAWTLLQIGVVTLSHRRQEKPKP
jgi:hypothetical protein